MPQTAAAIKSVAAGEAALDPAIQHHVVAALATPNAQPPACDESTLPDGLTRREAEVLALIADGASRIDDVDCIATSFPKFVGTLRALGARIDVVEG